MRGSREAAGSWNDLQTLAGGAQRGGRERQDVAALEDDAARLRRLEAEDRAADRALAAARFADEREGPTRPDLEADVGRGLDVADHTAHQPRADRIPGREALDREEHLARRHRLPSATAWQ
jgi:hypothetical protein